MSFELKHSESVGDGLERISSEQLDDTLKLLKKRNGDLIETVHEVRKDGKKVRAALHLARAGLSAQTYRYENEFFRDIGHQLSDARDAQILVEAIDNLHHRNNEGNGARSFEKVRTVLLQQRDALNALLKAKNTLQYLVESLEQARKRIGTWNLNAIGFQDLESGVCESFKRGRAVLDLAYSKPSFENFHDCRKRVKCLHYQARILHRVWPEVLDTLEEETGKLGDLLGEDHDLGVLGQLLKVKPDLFGGTQSLRNLTRLIERRRESLRKEARPLGEKVYHEKPKVFVRRLEAVWQAW